MSREDSNEYTRFQVQSDFVCNIVKKMWMPLTSKQINNVQYDELAF